MEYLTVRKMAERWGLSDRTVQQLCNQGRIPGARKFGRAWAIPADAEKPDSPHRDTEPAPAPPAEEPVRLTCGGLELDPRRRTVTVQGEEVSLTFKEFELLAYLLRNKGLVLTREQIMRAVWGFDFEGESRTVDMHIKQLRQKLGSWGTRIVTVRGVGYKVAEDESV